MTPSSKAIAADRDRLLRIDRYCDEFERLCQAGTRPDPADFLAGLPKGLRDDLVLEIVLLDIEYRRSAGERPTVTDYREKFPNVELASLAAMVGVAAPVVLLPMTLGEYDLSERLGGGGMGEVFLAQHRRMKRRVAVKVLAVARPDRDEARLRFERETRITALLAHPNVVTAFDAREDAGLRYLVTEYMPGGDLGRYVRSQGPLSPAAACAAIRQAALGLGHAHEHGVIHRDVKPGNLLRDASGTVRVADWGLARIRSDPAATVPAESLTDHGSLIGTVDYLAPEQAQRPDRVGPAADVYSLGCTLFFLLAGRPPFAGGGYIDRIAAHRSTPPPDVREFAPEVPESLAGTIATMLAKLPGDRPATMADVIAQLHADAIPAAEVGKPRWSRRRLMIGGLALAVAAATSAWFMFGTKRDIESPPDGLRSLPIEDIEAYRRDWATRSGAALELTDAKGMKYCFIPPGTFRMGSPPDAIARFADPRVETSPNRRKWVEAETERLVSIRRPYYLGRTEVTHAEFEAFSKDTGHKTVAERYGGGWGFDEALGKWQVGPKFSWRNTGDFRPLPDHPVANIAWEDAVKYCQWLTTSAPAGIVVRLPAESEWEFAARAGQTGPWIHGDDESELGKHAAFGNYALPRRTAERLPNAFGLFDMAGNLPEWCDPNDPWAGESRCPPQLRPARGGGFYSPAAHVRTAAFQWLNPHTPDPGFRVLREIAE